MPRLKGRELTELYRRLRVRILWCDRCGIPVIRMRTCPRCGNPTREVRLAPPGDARPASPHEMHILREAAAAWDPKLAATLLEGQKLILLNKVEAIDTAYEVIISGYSVGALLYDPITQRWRFRPQYYGAALALSEEMGPRGRTKAKIRPGAVIERGDIMLDEEPKDDLVLLQSVDGTVHALARRLPKGDYRVIKAWRALPPPSLRPSAPLRMVAEAHGAYLEERIEEAVRFVREAAKGAAVVTASGGKDSTVTLLIASRAGIKETVYCDTGVEFPESAETIEAAADKLGLRLHRAEARDAFWRGLKRYGPPARDYRWCTKLCKLIPMRRTMLELGRPKYAITGQRMYESAARALSGRVARAGPGNPAEILLAPIHDWSALEVFMALELYRLPINRLYAEGFDRIGCYVCPSMTLREMHAARELHPELMSAWEAHLRAYAKALRLPDEWLELALWRWRYSLPAEIERVLAERGIKARALVARAISSRVVGAEPISTRGRVLVTVILTEIERLDLDKLAELGAIIKAKASRRGEQAEFILEGARVSVSAHGRIDAEAGTFEQAADAVIKVSKLVFMVAYCDGCELCVDACPRDAIRPGPRLLSERCSGCGRCLVACPLAESLSKDVRAFLLALRRPA